MGCLKLNYYYPERTEYRNTGAVEKQDLPLFFYVSQNGGFQYVYCAGNPVRYIDPTGMSWEDADGNTITDHSKIKVYIFYDSKERIMAKSARTMYKQAEAKYGKGSVAMSNVITTAEFTQDWKDMASPDIKEVSLNYHGSARTINLDWQNNQYLSSTGDQTPNGNPATNINNLPTPSGNISNAQLNINSCYSNASNEFISGTNVAQAFRQSTSFSSIRATSIGVSYWNWFSANAPHPQDHNTSWQFLYRSVPSRHHGVGLPPK